MSLNDKEQEIWAKLESELLAEEGIRKAEKDLTKASAPDGKKLIAGVLLIVAGIIGLVISVANSSVMAGLASFGIMLYGSLFAYDHFGKVKINIAPKNTGFSEAYNNLKNYRPGNSDRW